MSQPALYTPRFLAMALGQLFLTSCLGAFYMLPLFLKDRGAGPDDVGLVMGAVTGVGVLARPLVSELVNRLGRKRAYIIGCSAFAAIPLTYLGLTGPFESFFWPLIGIRLVQGFALALCFTASLTYVIDIIPEDRINEGVGIFGTTGLTGIALGPAIAELIIKQFGYQTYFGSAAALGFMALIFILPLPETHKRQSGDSRTSFWEVLRRPKTLAVVTLALAFGQVLAATSSFVSLHAQEKAIVFVSLFFTIYSGVAILTRFFGGRLADKVGEARIIPYAFGISAAGLVFLVILEGMTTLVIAAILTGFGHGFLFPCLNSLAVRDEPVAGRAQSAAIFTGGIDAGYLLGAFGLGQVGRHLGYPELFGAAAIVLVAAMLYAARRLPGIVQNRPAKPRQRSHPQI